MAEWNDLSAPERHQAWKIFDSLRRHGRRNLFEICSTYAIPQKLAVRELSALEAQGMVTHTPAPDGGVRGRYYSAVENVRQRRFEALLEEWDGAFVDRDSVPTLGYDVDFNTDRFVLVEESTYGNGKWITTHETPTDAGSYHDSSEYPQDYDIEALIDLDTGEEYDAITDFDTEPAPNEQTSAAGELAHDIAEALEAALPEGVVIGEDERAVILQVIERRAS